MNFALGVDMMLLSRSFTVSRSAVGVPQSSGKLMMFPPIVIRVLYLSFLLSQKFYEVLRYYNIFILTKTLLSYNFTMQTRNGPILHR